MKSIILLLFICTSSISFAQTTLEIKEKRDLSIGESITFYSETLQEDRLLNIYLPASYKENTKKEYPVIYVLDGSLEEDIIHIAGLVQFCSFSWIQMIPESIVVGISNIDRKRDFTFPTTIEQDKSDFPTTGGSGKFIKLLETEVKAAITQNYRVNATSTLIGQSLGGLLATEVLLKKPALFDNYIIISPSLWWDDGSLLTVPTNNISAVKGIYIGVGNEGAIMERTAKQLFDKISKEENIENIYFKFFEQQTHGDALHLAVYDAFEKIFNNKQK